MCETYNGWTNRETWALNLWLRNDQGLYEMTRERVGAAVTDASLPAGWGTGVDDSALYFGRVAGEAVKDLWEELTDPDEQLVAPRLLIIMLADVGCAYRVNWDEIGDVEVDGAEGDES